ncbi:AraC family transcriptional regulator [Maridesulfovibrio sp.]|uniref:AraC family transcriptional regulator n=1 Tax=Maridesulfovibrio sp. TaxID=2795000 RepID=UPI0029CAA76E|nr:AraC family transcriptional regulator [Maridesulfovibrio sp.]
MTSQKTKLIFHELETIPDATLVEASGISNRFPRHVHTSFIFSLIDQGQRRVNINSKTITFKAGELCILPPGTPHSCESICEDEFGPHSYRAICAGTSLLQKLAGEICGKACRQPDFDPTAIYTDYDRASFEELFALIHTPETALEKQVALNSFLYQIIEKHSRGEIIPQKTGPQLEALQRVKDFIDRNYRQKLTLENLAETACLSPFHLQKLYVKKYGQSPQEHLIFRRVQKARSLIKKGVPLSEAAYNSGFSDQSHFSRHFKKVIGISPGHFFKENG